MRLKGEGTAGPLFFEVIVWPFFLAIVKRQVIFTRVLLLIESVSESTKMPGVGNLCNITMITKDTSKISFHGKGHCWVSL